MTMSRSEKREHEKALKRGELPNFQSPTLIQRLGRKQMTVTDYAEHRMGRFHDRVPADAVRQTKAERQLRELRNRGRTRTDFI